MEVKDLIKKYLAQSRMMQIATVDGDQPWICTVYYVEDEDLNLYWLSHPTRRHSQEIEKHNKVAVAIPIKFDKNPVTGIQAEGRAEAIKDERIVKKILPAYVEKYGNGKDFVDLFLAGKNQHWLYKFTPVKYKLFDENTFKDNPEKEWKPGL
jgi:uncharacterized protein YhbP (UPF0306 family)